MPQLHCVQPFIGSEDFFLPQALGVFSSALALPCKAELLLKHECIFFFFSSVLTYILSDTVRFRILSKQCSTSKGLFSIFHFFTLFTFYFLFFAFLTCGPKGGEI